MEGALGKETMKFLRVNCAGERPWLGAGSGGIMRSWEHLAAGGATRGLEPLLWCDRVGVEHPAVHGDCAIEIG